MRLRFGPLVKNWATVYGNCFPKGLAGTFWSSMTSSMTSITVSNPHNTVKKTDVFQKTQVRSVVAAFLWLRSFRSSNKTGKYLAAHHQILGCSPPNALMQPQYAVPWLRQCIWWCAAKHLVVSSQVFTSLAGTPGTLQPRKRSYDALYLRFPEDVRLLDWIVRV